MKYLAFGLLAFSIQAQAFTLASSTNPDYRGWKSAEIFFLLNSSNCPAGMDVEGVLRNAFSIWNNIATSRVHLTLAGSTTSTTTSAPTTIYCETNFQTVTGADQNSVPGAAATTKAGNYASGGIFYLNASAGTANIANFNQKLLAVILAHETGHILGLGHSEDQNALMYYDASAKTQLRLAQDDIDGASYLYPRNELAGDGLMGCGRISQGAPHSGGGTAAIIAMLLAPMGLLLGMRYKSKCTS